MKTRMCLTGFPLWRAENKVQSLLWRIPRNGEEYSIFPEAIREEKALYI